MRAWNYSALLWFGLRDGEGCLAGNWEGSALVLALQSIILGKLTKLVTAWISCREWIMALFLIGLKMCVEGLTAEMVGNYK